MQYTTLSPGASISLPLRPAFEQFRREHLLLDFVPHSASISPYLDEFVAAVDDPALAGPNLRAISATQHRHSVRLRKDDGNADIASCHFLALKLYQLKDAIDRDRELAKPNPSWLTIKQVAANIGCSYGEARARLLEGRIRAVKDGRWIRSRREWVEEYLETRTVRPEKGISDHATETQRIRKSKTSTAAINPKGAGAKFLRERKEI
jgi:excisionase family DNA binding protein